ncbi:MAG: hypothetical protein ABSF91_02075 [Bacteroidota bacterium]
MDIRRTGSLLFFVAMSLVPLGATVSQLRWTTLKEGVVYSDNSVLVDGDTITLRTVKNHPLGIEFQVELNQFFDNFDNLLEGPADSREWKSFGSSELGIKFRYPPHDSVAVDVKDSSILLFELEAEQEDHGDSDSYPHVAMNIHFTNKSFREEVRLTETFTGTDHDSIWDAHGDAGFEPAAYVKGNGWIGLYGENANMEDLGAMGRGLAWETHFFAMKSVSAGRFAVFSKTDMPDSSFLSVVSSFAVWR